MLASTALCASILLGTPGYVPAKLYRFKSGDNLAKIAKLNNTGYERLMDANPDLKPERIREGTVILIPARLPKNFSMTMAYAAPAPKPGAVKPAAKPERKSDAYYVRNGDNDWTIAPKFGITPTELRKMNPSVNWGNLKVGQPLRVPLKKAAPASTVAKSKPAPKAGGSYIVKSGDNDWIIARRLGITPAQLRTLNPGVNWSALQIGKSLKAPGKSGSSSASKSVAAATNRINTKRVAVNRTDVTVRSLPNTTSRKVTLVDRGLVAAVLDRKEGWYKLRFSTGLIGWVRGDMLKEVSAKESIKSTPRSTSSGSRVAKSAPSKAPVTKSGPAVTVAMGKGAPGSVISYAKTLMGTRYRWGGTSRGGFDCSGFTSHVFAKHGVKLPRTSTSQSQTGQAVSRGSLKTGDLVFFKTGRSSRVNHVGIYIGGGKFIHSSSGGGKVQINSLNDGYYNKRYAGGRRVSGGKSINVGDLEKEASIAKKAAPKPKPENNEKAAEKTTSAASTTTESTVSSAPPVNQNSGAVSTPPTEGGEQTSRVKIGADGIGR